MTSTAPIVTTTPDPKLVSLCDVRNLVDQIAEITDRPVAEVIQRLEKEHRSLGSNVAAAMRAWQLPSHIWSDRLAEFYSNTDAFLYETVVWNRTVMKIQMRQWIARFLANCDDGPMRILTFGDGLGFDSLYLAQAGHKVDYFDVSAFASRFAKRLFADHNVTIRILSDSEKVVDEAYDAVVCLDVLEHVPDPPELIASLNRAIRPGGRLIVHAPFWYVDRSVATHLRSNVKYSGDVRRLYKPHGLRPVDGELFWNPLVLEKQSPGNVVKKHIPPARVWLGGLLLKLARICTLPHLAVVRWMFARHYSKWPELEALRSGLK